MISDDSEILRQLDRCVDGELNPADESRLLLQLDSAPDGWKRLALGFIEARRWRGALREHAAAATTSAAPPRMDHSAHVASRRTAGLIAAMAASLVLGLLGGFGAARWSAAGSGIAHGNPQPETPAARPERLLSNGASTASRETREPAVDPSPDEPADPGDVLKVLVGGGVSEGAQELQLPLVPVSQVDPTLLDEGAAAVPEPLRAAWEKKGRSVVVNRRLYPVGLSDGRQVVVPIDDVEIRPFPPRDFQ